MRSVLPIGLLVLSAICGEMAAAQDAGAPSLGQAAPGNARLDAGYGPRPAYLIGLMEDGPLKDRLTACLGQPLKTSSFSIGHRGAAMMLPEHTAEGYRAAAGMGAGIVECDVTFTADKQLVCRHAQNDLHTTTNILLTDLAGKCSVPFSPAEGDREATAECRTSDITLAEFRSLIPKMDGANPRATTVEEYQDGTPKWRTDLYAAGATQMTHAESIALLRNLGVKFTPELKAASVEMPFDGMSQADYAQKMIDEYKAANIPPEDVWAQSFNLNDIFYWIENEPEFGAQAVYLIDDSHIEGLDGMNPDSWGFVPAALKARGVNYVAPAFPFLLTLDDAGRIVPSKLAQELKAADIKVITWTLERSGDLADGGGWYFHTLAEKIDNAGDYYTVLDYLAQDVGISGIFSDWPATTTFYANCMGL